MNQVLEQFKNKLAESWNTTDKALLNEFLEWKKGHKDERFDIGYGYKVSPEQYYIHQFGLSNHEREIILYGWYGVEEKNMKAAEKFVKNLEEKITAVTGEIKEITEYFTKNGKGWQVIGATGKANVIQIAAGGYNVQRLHIRNLIKQVK